MGQIKAFWKPLDLYRITLHWHTQHKFTTSLFFLILSILNRADWGFMIWWKVHFSKFKIPLFSLQKLLLDTYNYIGEKTLYITLYMCVYMYIYVCICMYIYVYTCISCLLWQYEVPGHGVYSIGLLMEIIAVQLCIWRNESLERLRASLGSCILEKLG